VGDHTGKPPQVKKTKPLPYLIRGIMGVIVSTDLIQELLGAPKASNFPVYIGLYFFANGLLSLKESRSAPVEQSGLKLSALTSIIGGIAIAISYPFSTYRTTLAATDPGRLAFGVIVGILGLLQVLGKVHVSPEPVLKRADLGLGALEALLGVVVVAAPIDWQARSVALIWVGLVAIYMFSIAHRLRRANRSTNPPQH
jgi:hypothetical protein